MNSAADAVTRLATTVTEVGEMAGAFLDEGIIVFFGDDAPEELRDVAIVHRPETNVGGITAGDVVVVRPTAGDETTMEVLAVGDVANDNMVALGHLVLKRNGSTTPAMPGDVCCDVGPIPPLAVGDTVEVVGAT